MVHRVDEGIGQASSGDWVSAYPAGVSDSWLPTSTSGPETLVPNGLGVLF